MYRSILSLRTVRASPCVWPGASASAHRERCLVGGRSFTPHQHERRPLASMQERTVWTTLRVHSQLLTGAHQDRSNENRSNEKFSLIYRLPAIRVLRAVSRLKLLQTGITVVTLPPVYYLFSQGLCSGTLVSYATGVAVFATVMLFSLSHYLRHIIGMMYINNSKTVLKVSHLTFWGQRRDQYVPVADIMTLGDTGDPHNEMLLRFKRYSHPEVLYFTIRLGQVVDKRAFVEVFGPVP
ncbi:transmembrane protein 186 isoform X1 [Lepisosteus oculatus]|uniref:Transmembrane protein 186 n=2 Tax=Lepisosteus oculatus TaxID=7918 RepID=W5MHT7_LEPOC|nr:PREDICTED: transmembrane protein 186 isoform X1 [Lepisosteus oculatus]